MRRRWWTEEKEVKYNCLSCSQANQICQRCLKLWYTEFRFTLRPMIKLLSVLVTLLKGPILITRYVIIMHTYTYTICTFNMQEQAYIQTSIHPYKYSYTHTHTCIHTCMNIHIQPGFRTHTHTHKHEQLNIRAFIVTHAYTYNAFLNARIH